MVKKNCINILACDDEAIITHLRNVKGKEYTDRDGNEFLSKFFQVTIRIPPFIGENLEKYTEELMNSRSVKFNPFVRNILISGAIENPRKINQFLNNAIALYRLAELKEKDQKLPKGVITEHTDFLTKMIVIRHEWPEFYKSVEENPDILNEQSTLQNWLKDNEDQPYYLRLNKFLNATQFSYVDDVIPFLRLNQESYAAESGIEEFANAVNTLDTKSEELFSKSEPEKQSQYLKKIEEMMDRNQISGDAISQVSCAISLIGILKFIEDNERRSFALAILGKHFSGLLLQQWDKFDIEKHDLFSLLEEMLPRFSKNFYDKLIAETFNKEGINQKLFNQFMKNGSVISADIMNNLDSEFSAIVKEPIENLEILVQCCNEFEWNKNNISKPAKTVSTVIKSINFDPGNSDLPFRNAYEKIEKNLNVSERNIFLEQIRSSILQFINNNQVLPESLITVVQQISEESLDENLLQREKIFEILSNSIEKIPDIGQNEVIVNFVINLAQKFNNLANVSIDTKTHLEHAIITYLDKGDHNVLLNFLNKVDSEGHDFLKSKGIAATTIERFMQVGPNNADIVRLLLKNIPYESQQVVAEKFDQLIKSKDPAQYSTLLSTAQELDESFNRDLLDSIKNSCKEIANDEENPERFTFYQHVLRLNPTYYETGKIIDYAEKLIDDDEQESQDRGLELLNFINSVTNKSEPPGVEKAIDKSIKLINNNPERIIPYLAFIFQYKDKMNYTHKRKLKDLFKEGLKPETSENILNNIVAYIKQSPESLIEDIFDDIIECAEKTPYGNAKEQCRQILVDNKGNLRNRQEESIKKIFGESVLD